MDSEEDLSECTLAYYIACMKVEILSLYSPMETFCSIGLVDITEIIFEGYKYNKNTYNESNHSMFHLFYIGPILKIQNRLN